MARWQPPYPDPHKGRPKRQPWKYNSISHLRSQILEELRCVFPTCLELRTEIEINRHGRTERYEMCDNHIEEAARVFRAQQRIIDAHTKTPAPKGPAEGQIYYAQVGDVIKIGYTTNLLQRMGSYPPGSRLLAVEPGTRKLERARHSLFTVHLSHGREWFNPNEELDAWIEQVIDKHGPPPFEHYPFTTPEDKDTPIVGTKRMNRRW